MAFCLSEVFTCTTPSYSLSLCGFVERTSARTTWHPLPEFKKQRRWAGFEIRAGVRERTPVATAARSRFAVEYSQQKREARGNKHDLASRGLPQFLNEFQDNLCREETVESPVRAELHRVPRIESDVNDINTGPVNGEKDLRAVCPCPTCGRRAVMAALGGLITSSSNIRTAFASNYETSDYSMIREKFHPTRSTLYEELYAQAMARTMVGYQDEVAGYKRDLFHNLDTGVEQILDLGIGTGPNLKYYATLPHLQRVVGVDPNLQMSKFCTAAAIAEGLSNSQFEFLHAVGEGIPVGDGSMDAVICTLVLCSVADVSSTLEEVKRVLKPGGAFLFMEHVAAADGTGLRYWQGLLDPLQQWVADGCHLTRNTLQYIEKAQFGSLQSQRFSCHEKVAKRLISPTDRLTAVSGRTQQTQPEGKIMCDPVLDSDFGKW